MSPLHCEFMTATVYIVDDNKMARDSLAWLLDSVDLPSQCFEDGQDFIDHCPLGTNGCVVLDIRMPKLNGMEVMKYLHTDKCQCDLPVIIVTGHGDVPLATRAMKAGAFDFIEKPYNNEEILERIQAAIAFNADQRMRHANRQQLQQRFASVTPREMEVLQLVAHGESNKSIASTLHISPKTVELHRSNLLSKSAARSSTELVRLAVLAEIVK